MFKVKKSIYFFNKNNKNTYHKQAVKDDQQVLDATHSAPFHF